MVESVKNHQLNKHSTGIKKSNSFGNQHLAIYENHEGDPRATWRMGELPVDGSVVNWPMVIPSRLRIGLDWTPSIHGLINGSERLAEQ